MAGFGVPSVPSILRESNPHDYAAREAFGGIREPRTRRLAPAGAPRITIEP
jgi:hypothetical protein